MKLSPNFTLEEATRSQTAIRRGIDNSPPKAVLANMILAADRMEKVREICGGRVVIVSSWYRSPDLNKAVGGAKSSDHQTGFAVDFRVAGLTVPATVAMIKKSGLKYDQLINEFGRWVHLSFGPRMRQETFKIG